MQGSTVGQLNGLWNSTGWWGLIVVEVCWNADDQATAQIFWAEAFVWVGAGWVAFHCFADSGRICIWRDCASPELESRDGTFKISNNRCGVYTAAVGGWMHQKVFVKYNWSHLN